MTILTVQNQHNLIFSFNDETTLSPYFQKEKYDVVDHVVFDAKTYRSILEIISNQDEWEENMVLPPLLVEKRNNAFLISVHLSDDEIDNVKEWATEYFAGNGVIIKQVKELFSIPFMAYEAHDYFDRYLENDGAMTIYPESIWGALKNMLQGGHPQRF